MRIGGKVAAALLLALVMGGLSYRGACFTKGRVLMDQEKIRLATAAVLSRQRSFIADQSAKKFRTYQADLDAEVDEFIRSNPSCCRIGPEGGDGYPEPTFWRHLTGQMSAIVVIEGEGLFSMNDRKRQFAITNCGKVW